MVNINKEESEVLELKETLSEIDQAGQTLAGFMNQNGGELYFGIKNNGDVVGIDTVTEKTIRQTSQYLIAHFEPKCIFTIEKVNIQGLDTIKITVKKSFTPYHTFKKKPYIRIGSSTVSMSQEDYRQRLLAYKNVDYSSTTVPDVAMEDLSKDAIVTLKTLLIQSGRYQVDIKALSDEQLLKDLLLIQNNQITIAALVLLGTESGLSKHLPFAEIRYGYKLSDSEIRNQDTVIFKGGYLLYFDKVWEKIQSRNIVINIPYGMRLIERKAFDEQSIREAINNAVIHRDYANAASCFVIQYPKRIEILSPGGLPEGVSIKNIMYESRPRNKLLADILFKCELVEQFGNGVNLMYVNQLSLGKNPPDYNLSTESKVVLSLDGNIQDVEFAKYVMRVAETKGKILDDEELIILNKIKNNQKVTSAKLTGLLDLGLIERVTTNKYMLSKQYYMDTDQKGIYTKKKGLPKERNKELIMQHIKEFGAGRKQDFAQIFGLEYSGKYIEYLLDELKKEEKIYFDGKQRSNKGEWKLVKK